ncbi:hypothetical protein [Synechococcus sp. PCC 6312]|uniref:hypothetical protein n=1 Tax=Synechococcus sp. (strain ATCC 27167 / PCC 6312) TaxID=195253 RepID=UPI00029F4926|nr:hypothetical protein [Synechococcus sp. PCC 6312]AFY60464.1 hypothetical protein Syn6312_1283 [Synechococcus sp. PCC 6312]
MLSFLALLPRALTTFLYAIAALLRFYGNSRDIPIPWFSLTLLDWSLLAFIAGTTALLVNLGLEWNSGNRSRDEAIEERERAAQRAYLQNRFAILQIRHQLDASQQTQAALSDFLTFLEEYQDEA